MLAVRSATQFRAMATRARVRRHPVEGRAPWTERPRWGRLYVMLLVVAGLGLAGDVMAASEGWRRLVDVVTAAAAFGAMALWLHGNRLRLACQRRHPDDERRERQLIRSLPESASRDLETVRRRSG